MLSGCTAGWGTFWRSMVRRRSTVRFRKGAPGREEYSEHLSGDLRSKHPRVREMAIAALDKHDAPVGVVARAYADDPEMRLLAAGALAPVSPPLRARIISTLARRPLSDATTTALLEQFDVERHGDVKVLAATSWARRIRPDEQAATRAVERLTLLLQAIGPDLEERRRAAFGALLVLGRAEVFS